MGHGVTIARPETGDLAAQVKRVHAASGGKLQYVLLLGDVKAVPCAYHQGVVIAQSGHERDPRIANDNAIADLDGDGIPELAVGRIPADDVAAARTMLDKVVRYETNTDPGAWRRRVNVIAGVGGFGALFDAMIESAATTLLRENVPAAYDIHVTYANPDSAFCPPPARVGEEVLARFNEGALLVAYLGHGSRTRLDRMHFGDEAYDIFDEESAYALEAAHGAPIVHLSTCSSGHFDGAPDCLAEIALAQPNGPVAIYASSRVSMPYANAVFSKELLDAFFALRAETVGRAMVLAKRHLMKPREGDVSRRNLDLPAALAYKPPAGLAEERAEHLYLYNLFGDPATRIPRPAEATVACAEAAAAGGKLAVTGTCPADGPVLVELVRERRSYPGKRAGDKPEDFARLYAAANRWVVARTETKSERGSYAATLDLPADLAPGEYTLRVWISYPPTPSTA
jgi:hypothetical protein